MQGWGDFLDDSIRDDVIDDIFREMEAAGKRNDEELRARSETAWPPLSILRRQAPNPVNNVRAHVNGMEQVSVQC